MEEDGNCGIPIGCFYGSQNTLTDYGLIMAIPHCDDATGGLTWVRQVIEGIGDDGLIIKEKGMKHDIKSGQSLPEAIAPGPLLEHDERMALSGAGASEILAHHAARHRDLMTCATGQPAPGIGKDAKLQDCPGIEVDYPTRGSVPIEPCGIDKLEVLMPVRGHLQVEAVSVERGLAPGGTMLINPGEQHAIELSMTGETSICRIHATNDPARPTR